MDSPVVIREYSSDDSHSISNIIRENLIKVNIKDYSEKIINNIYEIFTPEYIAELSTCRKVYVAIKDNSIIGTASLDKDTIYTVFIDIKQHNKGIGRQLIHYIEQIAIDSGITLLKLPSSITGQKFYENLGYHAVDVVESEVYGKDIIMIKNLIKD